MVYCVIPRELQRELLPGLRVRYADDAETAVIVDRRETERRRHDGGRVANERRVLRDRRRRRVSGELRPLYGETPARAA
jgi:hypothetical protein